MFALRFAVKASLHVGMHLGLGSMCSYFNAHEIEAGISFILYCVMVYELIEFARETYEWIHRKCQRKNEHKK
jgi:hypothetical protein